MNTTGCCTFRPLSWDPGLCVCGAMAEMHEPVIPPAVVDAPVPATIEDAELPTGVRMIDAMNRALFPSLFPGVEAPKR